MDACRCAFSRDVNLGNPELAPDVDKTTVFASLSVALHLPDAVVPESADWAEGDACLDTLTIDTFCEALNQMCSRLESALGRQVGSGAIKLLIRAQPEALTLLAYSVCRGNDTLPRMYLARVF